MYANLPDEVRVERDGPIRIVTLNRPDALNACNEAMHDGLVRLWGLLDEDSDAGAVVLVGEGRAFCGGGDLEWIRSISEDDDAARAAAQDAEKLLRGMAECTLPIVAAVNGPAVGLGCSLTVLADIVLMASDAYLCDPHINIGLVAGDGGVLWPFLTGLHSAKELLFLGERIGAEHAVRLGMANRVVAAEELRSEAWALAGRLAAQPAQALRATKQAMHALIGLAWPAVSQAAEAERASMRSTAHHQQLVALSARMGLRGPS